MTAQAQPDWMAPSSEALAKVECDVGRHLHCATESEGMVSVHACWVCGHVMSHEQLGSGVAPMVYMRVRPAH